jgi:hypothetical protein
MIFDFYERYKTYSSKELLRILKQQDAVATAEQILKQRNLTIDEIRLIEKELEHESGPLSDRQAAQQQNSEDSVLEPILHYKQQVTTPRWVKALLLLIAVQYAWSLYLTVKYMISFFRCETCTFEAFLLFQIFTLLYVPLIFLWVYKRNRWGWILLFADNFFTFLSRALSAYFISNFQANSGISVSSLLVPVLIKAFFLLMLWRREVAGYFGVAAKTKEKTALLSLLCGSLLLALAFYLQ